MNKNQGNIPEAIASSACARLAESAAATLTGTPAEKLRSRSRERRPVAEARQMAMYLAHVACGLSLTRVGLCFGRDRTTVRHACALIEDRRDDPRLEFGLAALEAGLVALVRRLELVPAEYLPAEHLPAERLS